VYVQRILDEKVLISVHKWLQPLHESVGKFNAEIARFEPAKQGLNYNKNEALNVLRLAWLSWQNDLRTTFAELREIFSVVGLVKILSY